MELEKERIYTEEEYEAFDHHGLTEYDSGHIIAMSPPSRIHQEIIVELSRVIGNFLQGKPCRVYVAPFNVRLKLNSGIKRVEPDIAVVCDKSKLTDQGCSGAPDFIIEVVSPSNKMHDYATKLKWYCEAGVREYWIVNPMNKQILVYLFDSNDINTTNHYTFTDSVEVSIFDKSFSINFTQLQSID